MPLGLVNYTYLFQAVVPIPYLKSSRPPYAAVLSLDNDIANRQADIVKSGSLLIVMSCTLVIIQSRTFSESTLSTYVMGRNLSAAYNLH